jgi:hypothetical protein
MASLAPNPALVIELRPSMPDGGSADELRYWSALLAAQGYNCFDAIRPAVWNDKGLPYGYRQNTFLY